MNLEQEILRTFFPAKTIFEVADRFADRRAAPILKSLYKECRNSGWSVFHGLWSKKHVILQRQYVF